MSWEAIVVGSLLVVVALVIGYFLGRAQRTSVLGTDPIDVQPALDGRLGKARAALNKRLEVAQDKPEAALDAQADRVLPTDLPPRHSSR